MKGTELLALCARPGLMLLAVALILLRWRLEMWMNHPLSDREMGITAPKAER